MSDVTVRQARREDHEGVAAFTRDTWPDRDLEDWLPEAFPRWVETDGDDQRTLVAVVDGDLAGVCQGLLLSADEAWVQGLRVHPEYRGHGVARAMTDALLSWCRDRGADVARNMVFSWNGAGLGQSRATGFDPAAEFRIVHPEPDADADAAVGSDPEAAWAYWQESDAGRRLAGLALDDEESWAMRRLTPGWLDRAADEGGLFVAEGEDGVAGVAVRTRTAEREEEGLDDAAVVAEYGAAAWDDLDAAWRLFGAIRADAAALGADGTRVVIPETVGSVSDAAAARVEIGDEPHFVLAADLTRR